METVVFYWYSVSGLPWDIKFYLYQKFLKLFCYLSPPKLTATQCSTRTISMGFTWELIECTISMYTLRYHPELYESWLTLTSSLANFFCIKVSPNKSDLNFYFLHKDLVTFPIVSSALINPLIALSSFHSWYLYCNFIFISLSFACLSSRLPTQNESYFFDHHDTLGTVYYTSYIINK